MKYINQKQTAEALGISQAFLSEILSGKKRPSPKMAASLEQTSGKHRLAWLYPGEYDNRGRRLKAEASA